MDGSERTPIFNGVNIPQNMGNVSSIGGDTSYASAFTEASSSSNTKYIENNLLQPVPIFAQQQTHVEQKVVHENSKDESQFIDSSDSFEEDSSSSCVFSSSGSEESPEQKVKKQQSHNLNLQFAGDVEDDDLFGSEGDSSEDEEGVFNFSTKSPIATFQPPDPVIQEQISAPQQPKVQQKKKVISVKSRVSGWLQFQLPDIPVPDDSSYVALLRTQYSDEALLANAKKNS